MSIFGWSYPPGCSGVPDDESTMSEQSEEIWAILEKAGVDESLILKVVNIVDDLAIEAMAECPQCLAAQAREAQRSREEFDSRPFG